MNNSSMRDFINNPQTIDFIVENSDYFLEYIKNRPYIIPGAVLTGNYLIAYISPEDLELVRNELGFQFVTSESVVLGLMAHQALEASGILQVQRQPYLSLRGQGVLMGVVDTGIDYTQNTFRYEDGTSKIVSIFDQTLPGTPPYEYLIGTEFTREQINEALLSPNPLSVVPSTDTVGHGTFLASVAAGRQDGVFNGAAPDAELIVVKLKKARDYYLKKYLIPPEQENAFESSAVMLGIDYIIRKAQQLGRPAAIIIGVGTNLGGHAGFSPFEDFIEAASALTGLCICAAAGNESEARHHFLGTIAEQEETQSVELRVGENAGDIYLNMWNNASDRMSVSIRSPTGEIIERVPARTASVLETRLVLERATVIVEYQFPTRGNGSQNTVIKIINATPGVWIITVFGDIILNGTFHIWLPITGFVAPGVEFFSPNPNYTVVVPATSLGPIVCGGYNYANNSLYSKSSWGPTWLPALAPDLVAPAVGVQGIYPHGHGTMEGTSVAAALTAGAGALMLQWGIIEGNDVAITTYRIRAYLIRGAQRSPDITYPNPQWGYGSLDLLQSFNLIR